MAQHINSPGPQLQPAQLSPAQMRSAIRMLERRLAEMKAFVPEDIKRYPDPTARSLEKKYDETLVEIFDSGSPHYLRYRIDDLCSSYQFTALMERPDQINAYRRGQEHAVKTIETLLEMLHEKLSDQESTDDSGIPATLEGLPLHPDIIAHAGPLYADTYYKQAVHEACIVLNKLVQDKSGIRNEDNTTLMRHVFKRDGPILAFNDGQDDTDKGVQEGMQHLYAGVFLAFRNPRSHQLADDDRETAFEMIHTISFLAKMLDQAKKVQ